MPELLSHLELGSSCGGCMNELVSTCRVMNNLAEVGCCSDPEDRGCAGYWRINDSCQDCCCDDLDPGGGISDAPWFDGNVPASQDFLGLHGSLELASPPNQTTVSSDGASVAAVPKQITFIGAIVSKSRSGTVFGEQWIEKQLLPDCPACTGRPVRFYLHCSDQVGGPVDTPQPGQVEPDPTAGWENPCGGCGCDEIDDEQIERLLPAEMPIRVDNGARDLLRVRYNPGSFSALPSEDHPIPYCAGKRVTFSFTVLESDQYLEPIEACRLDAESHQFDESRCFSFNWANETPEPVVIGKPGCEIPPVPTPTTEDRHSPTVAPDHVLACYWSKPLQTYRIACLTPYFAGDSADLIVRFNPGDNDVCNMAITAWESAVGWPHPANPVGRSVYTVETAVSRGQVAWAAPGKTIEIDGRTSITPSEVTGCGGGIYRPAQIDCGRRHWVAFDFDCDSLPGEGWSIEVDIAPKEKLVG